MTVFIGRPGRPTVELTDEEFDAILELADRGAEDLGYCIAADPESYDDDAKRTLTTYDTAGAKL